MGRLGDTFANSLLNTLFGGVATTAPATYYIGLSTTAPHDDGTGITEPSGNGYARVAVTKNTTNFPTASARSITNGTAITFPAPTGSWGTVGWFVLMDASSGGAMRAWGQLSEAQNPTTGTAVQFAAGSLTILAP